MQLNHTIIVRQSDTILALSSVFSSLSPTSLTSQLTSLRRDIISLYIERIAKQPSEVTLSEHKNASDVIGHKLSLFPSPLGAELLSSRLETLSTVLAFLDSHLFPHLPTSERLSFPRSLSKAIKDSVLQKLLASSMPSSLDKLPVFLDLVKRSVEFEETYVVNILGDDSERTIKIWADNVASHYERKRRTEILDSARTVVTREHTGPSFRVEVELIRANSQTNGLSDAAAASKSDTVKTEDDSVWDFDTESSAVTANKTLPETVDEDSWHFEESNDTASSDVSGVAISEGGGGASSNAVLEAVEDSGWDFDDDEVKEADPEPDSSKEAEITQAATTEEDPWGWNDDPVHESAAPNGDDNSAWDEPWTDETRGVAASPTTSVPKPARRLEKFSSKGKTLHTNGHSSPPALSPAPTKVPPPTPAKPQEQFQQPVATVIKESYLVSGRTKDLLDLVRLSLTEADELDASAIFAAYARHGSPSLIAQAASLTLDLYRGLYPITWSIGLLDSPKLSMNFSNDCLYMSGEVEAIARQFPQSREKLAESSQRLQQLSETWFDETIVC